MTCCIRWPGGAALRLCTDPDAGAGADAGRRRLHHSNADEAVLAVVFVADVGGVATQAEQHDELPSGAGTVVPGPMREQQQCQQQRQLLDAACVVVVVIIVIWTSFE